MKSFENVLIFILIASGMAASDIRLYKRIGRKELVVYALAAMPALYLGFIFMLNVPWPNLTDLLQLVFGKPALWIGSLIKPQ